VKREALAGKEEISNKINNLYNYSNIDEVARAESGGLQRIAEVPIYGADAIVRRAPALQKTRDAAAPVASMSRALADKLGLREGDQLRLRQGDGEAMVPYAVDDKLPADCIRLAAARAETTALGAATASIGAERVAAQHKVAV
jgi:NADH-quinone oxidoreductase subunit G